MAATKNATSVFSNSLTGNIVSASVARAAGEGLLCAVWQECDFAGVGSAGAPVWDAAGDNQAFTALANQQEWASANRRLSLFVLPAPTTAKTASVASTLAGGYGGATTHDRASMLVVRISGHDAADMIRASNARTELVPETNDLPNTVTSAAGDLVLYFGSAREFISEFDAGDTSGYEEFTVSASSRSLFVGTKAGASTSTTGTINYINATGQSNALIAVSVKAVAAPAPVLSSPIATATGPTQATIGVATDTAPTTTAISYQILPAATAAPSAATIVGAPDGTISTGSVGALTKAITALTTNTAVKVHFAQGTTSNVVSSASFTPNTLASSGSPAAQTGTAGGGITWTGATPDSLVTNHGNGSGSWSIVSSAGFTVAPSINTSTGVLSGGTLASAGSYSPQIRYTDSSTVPNAQQINFTLSLTVSGGVFDAAPLAPLAINSTLAASATVSSAAGLDFEVQPPILVGNGTNATLGITATLQFLSGVNKAPVSPLGISATLGIAATLGFSNTVQLPPTFSRARQYKVNPDEHLDAYAIQNQFVLTWEKDPDATLDYSIDWSDWLAEIPDDNLATMSVSFSSGIALPVYGIVGAVTGMMASGGLAGSNEHATVHITTNYGRVDERTINFIIRQR